MRLRTWLFAVMSPWLLAAVPLAAWAQEDEYYSEDYSADDTGGYEEPAYEEPAYEEPAYEEPAYEEPAYEEPAYDDTVADDESYGGYDQPADLPQDCIDAGIADLDACDAYLANAAGGDDEPVYDGQETFTDESGEDLYQGDGADDAGDFTDDGQSFDDEMIIEDEPQSGDDFTDAGDFTDETAVPDEMSGDDFSGDEFVEDTPAPDDEMSDQDMSDDAFVDQEDTPSDDEMTEEDMSDDAFSDEDDMSSDDQMTEEDMSGDEFVDEDATSADDELTQDDMSNEEMVEEDDTSSDDEMTDEDMSGDEMVDEDEMSSDDEYVEDDASGDDEMSGDETSSQDDFVDEDSPGDETYLEADEPTEADIEEVNEPDEFVPPEEVPFDDSEDFPVNDEGVMVEQVGALPEGLTEEDLAPVSDSAKEYGYDPDAVPEDVGPPPESDSAAQVFAVPEYVDPVADMEPTSLDAPPSFETPSNVTVINNNTYIYEVNNQTFINNYYEDQQRLAYNADEVLYDYYDNGTYSESVVRPDGSQVITIRDAYGNIISRTLYDEYGNEYQLAYFDPAYMEDERMYWGDVGYNMPPLVINVPINQYIFYYDRYDTSDLEIFFRRPPVEKVQRLYTIDEVKRSARLRDMLPRVEIPDLNFATGSAQISKSQVKTLKKLADAIKAILKQNPGETFLIEGHTDAVGSDQSNLKLSDARAVTVANALTKYFGIPPENLVTQGYGEKFLKVVTPRAEPANRRVVVRRITPLITPVAVY